ncbi:MAG: hypothetical protein K6E17_09260 [Clostridiales bacterium]|nr:hypothetical protein [Clostridiales bacterium]
MKKLVSLFLCVTILCAAAATCAETTINEHFHFSPGLVSSVGLSAEEWIGGGLTRGMFTVFILLDYTISLDGSDAPFDLLETQNSFYVGKMGDVVSLMVIPEDLSCGLVLSYDVSMAEASG